MASLELHESRLFDADPQTRNVAHELYDEIRDLPLVCPHGHVEPGLLADNEPFPEPTTLIVRPDHYIFRMLYSQGVSLEELGIPSRAHPKGSGDPRHAWQLFAERYYLFAGTPTGFWLNHQLHHLFGVRRKLDGESAMYVYDQINEKLASPEYRPRALFDRFNIEVLTTTDAAADSLDDHARIGASDWNGRVIPCFRPDAALAIASPGWNDEIRRLSAVAGRDVADYATFIEVLEERRAYFREFGCVSTDHAVVDPLTHRLSDDEAGELFQRALAGDADTADERRFQAHMLMEMARMSSEDGLVMQLHPGSDRNHNRQIFEQYGTDKGADMPLRTEYTRNLKALLNDYGNHPAFRLIVFTLDESTYSRELAPLAGHYPAMRLGPAWWFFDSVEGMARYRATITETAGIYNTVGFNDDTRAFCSIPARHDVARRVDANYVAGLVTRHIVDMSDARQMVRAMAYDLARESYRLADAAEPAMTTTTR
jgi:glucuronate isomerase